MSAINFLKNTKGITNKKMSGTNPPSAAQYEFYCKLAKRKGMAAKDMLELTQASVSQAIDDLQKMDDYRPISYEQYRGVIAKCTELGIKIPDDLRDWSGAKASKLISKLNNLIPASENQIDMLLNFWRFGIIEDINDNIKMPEASALIDKHIDALRDVSFGKATLPQCKKVIELQEKIGDEATDIKDLSKMSVETCSEFIDQLQEEIRNKVSSKKVDLKEMPDDTDRNREGEDLKTLCYSELEQKSKEQLLRYLANILGQEIGDVDTDEIDLDIVELQDLVLEMGFATQEQIDEYVENLTTPIVPKKRVKKATK